MIVTCVCATILAGRHTKLVPLNHSANPQTYVFRRLRSCSECGLTRLFLLSFADIHLLKAASIELACWKQSLTRFCACQELFCLSVWLIIPAHTYSIECRSTRKQRIPKACNGGLFLVTGQDYSSWQRRYALVKEHVHRWNGLYAAYVALSSTFSTLFKRTYHWDLCPLMPLI